MGAGDLVVVRTRPGSGAPRASRVPWAWLSAPRRFETDERCCFRTTADENRWRAHLSWFETAMGKTRGSPWE